MKLIILRINWKVFKIKNEINKFLNTINDKNLEQKKTKTIIIVFIDN